MPKNGIGRSVTERGKKQLDANVRVWCQGYFTWCLWRRRGGNLFGDRLSSSCKKKGKRDCSLQVGRKPLPYFVDAAWNGQSIKLSVKLSHWSCDANQSDYSILFKLGLPRARHRLRIVSIYFRRAARRVVRTRIVFTNCSLITGRVDSFVS